MDQAKNHLTIDGVNYDVAQFSDTVQQAVTVYHKFAAELQQAQLEVLKLQAAMQTIGSQIGDAVKKELAAKDEPEAEQAAAE